MMMSEKFDPASYFLGQADACELFIKQCDDYIKATTNPGAIEFCENTIIFLLETQKNFKILSEKNKVNDAYEK